MKNKYMIIAILAAVCCAAAIVYALRWRMEEELPQKPTAVRRIATRKRQAPEKKPENKKPEEKKEPTTPPFINGTVTDTEGTPMAGVVVSNGIDCAATDSLGRYKLPNAPRHASYSSPCRQTARCPYTLPKTTPHISTSP